MARYAFAGLLLFALAGTAIAQEFYIVRGADKKCQVFCGEEAHGEDDRGDR